MVHAGDLHRGGVQLPVAVIDAECPVLSVTVAVCDTDSAVMAVTVKRPHLFTRSGVSATDAQG